MRNKRFYRKLAIDFLCADEAGEGRWLFSTKGKVYTVGGDELVDLGKGIYEAEWEGEFSDGLSAISSKEEFEDWFERNTKYGKIVFVKDRFEWVKK